MMNKATQVIALALAFLSGECLVGAPAQAAASRLFSSTSSQQLTGTGTSAASPYTFVAWVNVNANADAGVFAIHNGSTAGYGLRIRDAGAGDGLNAGILNGGCSYVTFDSYTITPGTWALAAVVFDGAGNVVTFYNGTKTDGSEICTDPSVAGIYIGSYGGILYYDGYLAHVACWSVALSLNELLELNQGLLPFNVQPENLTGYWPVIGDSPEPDMHGGTDLTVTGSPSAQADGPPVWTR